MLSRSLRSLGSRVSARQQAVKARKSPFRRSYSNFASRSYLQHATNSVRNVETSKHFDWLPFASIPIIGAGFWGFSDNDNTIEKVNEDIELLATQLDKPDEETVKLAMVVIRKVMALPDTEIRRDLMYLLAAISSASKAVSQVNPYASEAEKAAQLTYEFAKRVNADSKHSAELKLDSTRCAHKAEYFVYMYRQDYDSMKVVLEKDVKALQAFNKSQNISDMTLEESQAIWMLSAVMGNLDDPQTKSTLEKSLEIFKGVKKGDMTPALEKIWIERLVSTLSHGLTLEIGSHDDSSKEFKRIALAMYEQYTKIAPEGSTIPAWKELETHLKSSVMADGPQ